MNLVCAAEALDPISYREQAWGDVIKGTREQLQALGMGVGMAFPGGRGAPRQLRVKDPTGHSVTITRALGAAGRRGIFVAKRAFHPWPQPPKAPETEAFEGVLLTALPGANVYAGAAVLIAAGLVQADQLPGAPGQSKTRVTIAGQKTVQRAGQLVEVLVAVSPEETARRWAAHAARLAEWMRNLAVLTRPERLRPRLEVVAAAPAPAVLPDRAGRAARPRLALVGA